MEEGNESNESRRRRARRTLPHSHRRASDLQNKDNQPTDIMLAVSLSASSSAAAVSRLANNNNNKLHSSSTKRRGAVVFSPPATTRRPRGRARSVVSPVAYTQVCVCNTKRTAIQLSV